IRAKTCIEGSNPSLSAIQSGLQRNAAAFLQKLREMATIPRFLPETGSEKCPVESHRRGYGESFSRGHRTVRFQGGSRLLRVLGLFNLQRAASIRATPEKDVSDVFSMDNVTRHPTSAWIAQQLRGAFPYQPPVKFLILDHDSKYGSEVPAAIRSMGIGAIRTAVACPWQNGVAERWIGSCRRELLDYVIPINEKHLKRLLSAYITYYHQDRTHCGLEKQTPEKRMGCAGEGKVIAWPRVGGLHHRYERAA